MTEETTAVQSGRQQEGRGFASAAVLLQELQDHLPADHFTLDWIMVRLGQQSFGLVILILAILAAAPPLAIPGGLLILIPAVQMIVDRRAPKFPNWIAARPLPTPPLRAVLRRAIPGLKLVEKVVYRRRPSLVAAAKRFVGVVILLLAIRLLTYPLPFSNVVPALLIALISLVYLEEDGLMLSLAMVTGLIVLATDAAILWKLAQQISWPTFT
jgi:hypothetical protein